MSRNFTLCLSGGGFRATLYHLGVIRALYDFKLLRNVKEICSVSGGSIIAAHLVLNWEKYCGSDDNFREAAQELTSFVRADLRGRIVRRWLLAGWWWPRYRRISQLIRAYDKLYKGALLQDLGKADDRPTIAILATSMISGDVCAFTSRGVRVNCLRDPKEVVLPRLAVSSAVAASSAFPPLFPPVKLDRKKLRITGNEMQAGEVLTDAGVIDNLGVAALPESEMRLFISDASAAFHVEPGESYGWIIDRTIRSTDILMSRIAKLEEEKLERRQPLIAKISKIVASKDVPKLQFVKESIPVQSPAVQDLIQFVRTDLDLFSDVEIDCIFLHGYEVALATIASLPELDPKRLTTRGLVQNPLPWRPSSINSEADDRKDADRRNFQRLMAMISGGAQSTSALMSDPELLKHLELSTRRKLRLWNSQDTLCWIVALFLLLVVLAVAGTAIWKIAFGTA